jgi:hypothetical protein
MQLFNLKADRGEQKNCHEAHPEVVDSLLKQLGKEVSEGRCTPGKAVSNDRDVSFLPKGVAMPAGE